jgi:hypothetical protein
VPITDGIDVALAKVALDLLTAQTGPPQLVVFDGVVPANTPVNAGYVLVYCHLSRSSDDPDNSANGRSGVWICRWILHCVSGTASGARGVAARASTALLDVQPVVAGLSCGRIRLEDSLPPQRDETTGVLVMDSVATYRLRATS